MVYVCNTFVRVVGGRGGKRNKNLKHKVAGADWWIWTYGDLIFQVIRLLSQLFHFTHGGVCQARLLQ